MKPEAAENILQGLSLFKSEALQGVWSCILITASELDLSPRCSHYWSITAPFGGSFNEHIILKYCLSYSGTSNSNGTKNHPRKLHFDFNFLKIVQWSMLSFRHPQCHPPSDGVSLITTWPVALGYHRKVPSTPHFCHCRHHPDSIPGGCLLSLCSPRQACLSNRRATACLPPWTVTGLPHMEAQSHSRHLPSTGPGDFPFDSWIIQKGTISFQGFVDLPVICHSFLV